MDYEKLTGYLKQAWTEVPDILDDCLYDGTIIPALINCNPYKNHGALLPEEFLYKDNRSMTRIGDVYKGKQYFPRAFCIMQERNDPGMFPHLMAYSFIRDVTTLQKKSGYTVDPELSALLGDTTKSLKKAGYPIAHNCCITTLPISRVSHEKAFAELVERYVINPPVSEAVLAKAVSDAFAYVFANFRIQHWHYPEEEYAKARSLINAATSLMAARYVRKKQE